MARMIDVIGVPYHLGGTQNGTRGGPEGLVQNGFLAALEGRGHNVTYANLRAVSGRDDIFCGAHHEGHRVRYADELIALIPLLARQTGLALVEGSTPLVLGGDHSIVMGSIGAALHPDALHDDRLGLVWIDAHYDAHTEWTTHTGNTHGMPLAALLGEGRQFRPAIGKQKFLPSQVIHIGAGVADCEPEEIALLSRLGVPCFPETFLAEKGWSPVYAALQALSSRVERIWVSFDLDSVCVEDAPGVSYRRLKGGLTRQEVLMLANWLSHTGKVVGADIVEMNFQYERLDAHGSSVTAHLASEFACQLLK